MRLTLIGIALGLCCISLCAADHAWRTGTLQNLTVGDAGTAGTVTVPIGGSYFSIPFDAPQVVTIDADGLRYVMRGNQRVATIINEPITFAIEKDWIYIKGPQHTRRYKLISTTRLER